MLEVKHISFSWGSKALLGDVSFSVRPGEVVVLAGANGAGKTTLMKILAGLCTPSSGTVCADGVDAFRYPLRYRRALGYLGETAPADDDMRVRDYLRYRANLRGEMAKKIRHRVAEAMDLCGLEEVAQCRVARLSQGQRKRVALADALLLRPRYLLLDDLFAGLDPVARVSFGRVVAAVASVSAVLISGHELDDLSYWAKRYLVLVDGELHAAANPLAAKRLLGLVPVEELA